MKSLYSVREERLNWITHLLGAILSIIGTFFLLKENKYENNIPIIVYGISMFFMFFSSFSYHFAKKFKIKGFLQKIDHSAIYVFIPSCFLIFLTYLVDSSLGFYVIITQYIISIIGIIMKVVFIKKFKKLHLAFYLGLGWSALLFLPDFIKPENLTIFLFILLGGILYTIGVYFYKKKTEFSHFIWHLFILAAVIVQFIANYMIVS